MEDTGEMIHIMHSDLHRRSNIPMGNSIDNGDADSAGSDLDQGRVRRPRKLRINKDADMESDLDRSGSQRGGAGGRRRINEIAAEAAEDDETESDLDQGGSTRVIPGKKTGKMGIMRRKGVSKSKGSPYRSSGSSHEDDSFHLVTSTSSAHNSLERRRNGMLDCISLWTSYSGTSE